MNLESIDIAEATMDELYTAAYNYGYNIADWQDVPRIGDRVTREIDWIGIGTIETSDDQREALEMMAQAAEKNSRCFTPAEFWIRDLNERPDADQAWDTVEVAISDGIRDNVAERDIAECLED